MKLYPKLLGACSTLALACFSFTAVHAATIDVTETTDGFDGATCTLRNAIESVNDGADFGGCVNTGPDAYGTNDTITLVADTYVLSLDGSGEDDNEVGDLDIHTSVTLTGAGADQTAISASGFSDDTDRVLHVVEFANGVGTFDPAITVTFQDLSIRDGQCNDNGGGLAVEFFQALVNLNNVTVTENFTNEDGGGIYNSDAQMRLESCSIRDNEANSDAGAMLIDGEGFSAIFNSTLDGNIVTDDGGAIHTFGALLLVNSTVSNNQAVQEGPAEIVISGGDFGGDGGGINAGGGVFLLLNSTISNNTAGFLGGGVLVENIGDAGSSPLEQFSFIMLNTTVAENTVLSSFGFGGGICIDCEIEPQGTSSSPFAVFNSLVFGNESVNSPDCGGDYFSGGFNLIGDIQACTGFTATGDQTGVADAGIGPLQNNGGPTETHALLEGSPAIDMANNVEGCQGVDIEVLLNEFEPVLVPLTEDQRGFTRPVAVLDPAVPVCDIGAYEFQIAEPTPTPTPTATPVPPFNALLEGSGCSLASGSSAAASGLLWSALALFAGFYGWRRLQDRA